MSDTSNQGCGGGPIVSPGDGGGGGGPSTDTLQDVYDRAGQLSANVIPGGNTLNVTAADAPADGVNAVAGLFRLVRRTAVTFFSILKAPDQLDDLAIQGTDLYLLAGQGSNDTLGGNGTDGGDVITAGGPGGTATATGNGGDGGKYLATGGAAQSSVAGTAGDGGDAEFSSADGADSVNGDAGRGGSLDNHVGRGGSATAGAGDGGDGGSSSPNRGNGGNSVGGDGGNGGAYDRGGGDGGNSTIGAGGEGGYVSLRSGNGGSGGIGGGDSEDLEILGGDGGNATTDGNGGVGATINSFAGDGGDGINEGSVGGNAGDNNIDAGLGGSADVAGITGVIRIGFNKAREIFSGRAIGTPWTHRGSMVVASPGPGTERVSAQESSTAGADFFVDTSAPTHSARAGSQTIEVDSTVSGTARMWLNTSAGGVGTDWTLINASEPLAYPPRWLEGLNPGSATPELGPGDVVVVLPGSARDTTDAHNIDVAATPITADITASGLGGLDVGVVAADTWYGIHVVADSNGVNPTGVVISLATLVAPWEYQTPTLPAGYDISRRVGSCRTDPASAIIGFITDFRAGRERVHTWYEQRPPIVASGTALNWTLISATNSMPLFSTRFRLKIRATKIGGSSLTAGVNVRATAAAPPGGLTQIDCGCGIDSANIIVTDVIAELHSRYGGDNIDYQARDASADITVLSYIDPC